MRNKLIAKLLNCFIATNGFVLIELIIVTAIIGLVTAIGSTAFVSYNRTQKLQSATNDLETVLNVAKSNSFSQIKDSALCSAAQPLQGYKVVISCSNYDLYVVCAGAPDQKIMKTKSLPENVMLGKSLPMSVFFPILKSQVSGGGTIPLTAFGESRCLQIDAQGVLSEASSCPAPVVCSTPTPTPTPTVTPTPTPTPTVTPTPTPTPVLPPTPTPTNTPTPTPTSTPTPTPTNTPTPTPTPTPCAGISSSCNVLGCCPGGVCVVVDVYTRTCMAPTPTPTPIACVAHFGNCNTGSCCAPFSCIVVDVYNKNCL